MPDTSNNSNAELHLVQMWLEVRRLVGLARALHLPIRQTDHNYIVHCALRELFGDDAPMPFSLAEDGDGRCLRVLGYCSIPGDALQANAQAFANPDLYTACDWERMASKAMPATFPRRTRLGFSLRACPVVRKAAAGEKHAAGAEVDAFLARVWEVDDPAVPLDREQVYCAWLNDQFTRRCGARLLHAGMDRFSIERMVRRTQGPQRKAHVLKRPAVTLSGELEVTDAGAFFSLLQRGIGRHKSFGFGMLKIRRPGR